MLKRKRNSFLVFSALLCALFLWTSNAAAALVSLTGDNVIFTYDDSNLGLFGTPKVTGDTIFFFPTNFKAQSTNGSGFSIASSTVSLGIQTKSSDLFFGSLTLVERGDYLMLGSGGSVGVAGALIATNNLDPLGPNVYAPISSSSNLTIIGFPTKPWEAIVNADLNQWGWNSITATLENLQIASTTPPSSSSLAFIEKKFVGLGVNVVPIPGAIWMLGAGLIGLAVIKKRNQ
jgi:hypothetical protein